MASATRLLRPPAVPAPAPLVALVAMWPLLPLPPSEDDVEEAEDEGESAMQLSMPSPLRLGEVLTSRTTLAPGGEMLPWRLLLCAWWWLGWWWPGCRWAGMCGSACCWGSQSELVRRVEGVRMVEVAVTCSVAGCRTLAGPDMVLPIDLPTFMMTSFWCSGGVMG